jgi:pimeloyl-ACP methyl ester carboxylesterase
MKVAFKFQLTLIAVALLFNNSCSNDSETVPTIQGSINETTIGSGVFEYTDYEPFNGKTLRIFYHIPSDVSSNTPIIFVFHGNSRNAFDYRNAMVEKANAFNFIVIAPEFSNINFPTGDAYNLGNVFVDGDNPSASTLNPEEEWTFSVIEPLFDYIKQNLNNTTLKYHVFGHSAGAQFAHRFAMFKPHARYDKMVVSAGGWYTVTDLNIRFPYGFGDSPLEHIELSNLFNKQIMIQVGSLDNDPNAPQLRRNEFADAQGLNRLARAQHFYNKAAQLAQQNGFSFQWELHVNANADHNFMVASQKGADLIFN